MAYLHEGIRQYLPKNRGDWIAFIFTTSMMHIMGFFELFVILPYIDERGSEAFWVHVLIGTWLYANTMFALYKVLSNQSGTAHLLLPAILKPNWRYCSQCEANAPPRSFHCVMCSTCVLVRDHHCVFTGNCIGYHNRRYYVQLLLYIWLAAAYCNFLHVDYVIEMLHGSVSWRALLTMFFPLIAWGTGITESYKFSVSFISSSSIICFLLVGALIGYHMIIVLAGQTTHERGQGCRDYDYGYRANLRETFGVNWQLSWVSPFIPSPLPGNGIDIVRREEVKNI